MSDRLICQVHGGAIESGATSYTVMVPDGTRWHEPLFLACTECWLSFESLAQVEQDGFGGGDVAAYQLRLESAQARVGRRLHAGAAWRAAFKRGRAARWYEINPGGICNGLRFDGDGWYWLLSHAADPKVPTLDEPAVIGVYIDGDCTRLFVIESYAGTLDAERRLKEGSHGRQTRRAS